MVYVKGDPVHLAPAAVALVGARNASASGRRYSRDLARALGQAGLIVVSGLARGIDTAAHQGALDSGTVAVLAGGVDVVYPSENQALYEAIAAAGAVLSEMPPGTTPRARHFPRRNRLISGLALGVVVIEAAERSGSLITARFALEQGREVFAVPGSPLDPRCRGGNRLIKQGAQLVQDPEDVLEAIRPMVEQPIPREAASSVGEHPIEPSPSAAGRDRLLGLLGPTPVDIDELIRLAELTPAGTITMLLELELAGRLERHPGNRVSLS